MTSARSTRARRTARRATAVTVTVLTAAVFSATLTGFTAPAPEPSLPVETTEAAEAARAAAHPATAATAADRAAAGRAPRPAPGSGRLLKAVDLPAEARPHGGPGKSVEYASTGAHGGRVTVSGLVFAPAGKPPKGGWPVVSLAHGTVGSADVCAPSRVEALTFGRDPEVRGWLDRGVAVVATDYEGLGTSGPHPYLHGRSAAYGTIDIVRAARQARIGTSGRWVASGQSQGGHAAINAALYATRYAPELDFRGAAATAPPTTMTRLVLDRSDSTSDERAARTSLYPLITEGLRAIDPGLDFDHLYSERGRELIPTARTKCSLDVFLQVRQSGLGDSTVWKQRPETEPALLNALRRHVDTPVARLDRPLFIGQGARDEIVQAGVTSDYAEDLRRAGSDVTYREYPTAGHMTVPVVAAADLTAWVERRLGLR
ncbi:lipase family protein [Streptomyces sp. JNUCC 64]